MAWQYTHHAIVRQQNLKRITQTKEGRRLARHYPDPFDQEMLMQLHPLTLASMLKVHQPDHVEGVYFGSLSFLSVLIHSLHYHEESNKD